MKNRVFGIVVSLVVVLSLHMLGFTGVQEAGAAPDDVSITDVQFDLGGSHIGYFIVETPNDASLYLNVYSTQNRIETLYSLIRVDPNDTSEVNGFMVITGRKNSALNQNNSYSYSNLIFGDVSLSQGAEFAFWDGANSGHLSMSISPFALDRCQIGYSEYVYEVNPGVFVTEFNVSFQYWGSFGPGAEGDRLGAPFVPTPGAACVAVLAGLVTIRRRR